MLRRTGGIPSPPLDDTYIYLQYARRAAEGHFLSYCDGADPSTGASSYLHLLLLVPGWWAGFHGTAFVLFALALGGGALFVALAAAGRAAFRLTDSEAPWAPLAVLLLVALNGHFIWAAMTGMDTVLYAAGLVTLVAGVARSGPRPGWTWLLAGALPLFRPEGMVLGFLAIVILYAAAHREAAREGVTGARRGGGALRRLAFAGTAGLLLFVPAFVNWRMTGSPIPDGMAVKSLFAETRPDVLQDLLRRLPGIWREIVLLHVNDFRSKLWTLPATWALMALTGSGLLTGAAVLASGRRGPAGVLVLTWLAAGILLGGLTPAWHSHYFRYQIPYVPLAALATVAGWDRLSRLLPEALRSAVKAVLLVATALLLVPGWNTMKDLYGRNCANILEQQTRVARWIAENTQPRARIAVNDAGAIAYYGNRRIVDLVGLTTHGFSVANHNGAGGLFEKLESMPLDERPNLMAIYPRWYPYLAATHFVGSVIFSADLADNTICGDRLMRVYRIDWSLAGSGKLPVQREPLMRDFGMTLADEVDVGDLASEASHGYAWDSTFKDLLREYPTGTGPVVEDGGRWISRGETMKVRAKPANWLILVMRTETEVPFELDVRVNGRPAGRLAAGRVSQSWSEPIVQIPDSLVTDSLLTVDLRWVTNVRGDGYNSYHYWFIQ